VSRNPIVVVALVAACIVLGGLAQRNLRTGLAGPRGEMPLDAGGETIHVTPTARRAGLRFADHVAPGDRQWVLASIAAAQPRARGLIAEVDGMVTVETAGQGSAMGLTTMRPRGFTIWLNLARLNGTRKIDRNQTVLHEFGHVVDFALLDAGTDRRLDDAIPRTGSCMVQDGTRFGDCAAAEERIADTFAKWALGNAVSAVGAGYAISDPPSLADWGRPLDTLAASLPAA
jgi:hypothetical protein